MAFVKYYDAQLPVAEPACIHLRSKAMYVTGSLKDSEHPDEAGSQSCWCNITQHVIGPDRSQVSRPACIAGRECYKDTH